MAHSTLKTRTLAVAALLFCSVACVDSAYDLGNISLKMTLGPNGVTLPLGRVDSLTLDSIMRQSEIDKLVTEDGFYAYKLVDSINKQIDAVKIEPIRNVIPVIDPHRFKFTNATLPESISAKGFSNDVTIKTPDLDFTRQTLKPVQVAKTINIDKLGGAGLPDNTPFTLDELTDKEEDFSFSIVDIPTEVAEVRRIYFSGDDLGTPMNVSFSTGSIHSSVKSGFLTLEINMPSQYTLQLGSNYNGKASVNGSKITVTNYPIIDGTANFTFYMAERSVSEPIVAQKISIQDKIEYSCIYSGVANGTPLSGINKPQFTLNIAPQLGDALILTNRIVPEQTQNTSTVNFEIDKLDGVSRVDYIAFTNSSSNALTLGATGYDMPLNGDVPVVIAFPTIFEFAPGISGMNGTTYTTTMDKLAANNIILPLSGMRLIGDDGVVVDDKLVIDKPVVATVTPDFPGAEYKISDIKRPEGVQTKITAKDMTLRIDADQCEITAGFTKPVEIVQAVNQTFSLPNEVKTIKTAQVMDANYGMSAIININLDIKDSPVHRCYFDNIEIVLPAFIQAEHPNLDPKTNTIRIKRVEYKGTAVSIAKITLKAIQNVPVKIMTDGKKQGVLTGEIRIKTTANVPDNTSIAGLEDTEITLLPQAAVSPLKVVDVLGTMDIDLAKYLEPTTIDLDDISKSLGDQDVEINLIAPLISLDVQNPIGVTMVGNISLQPYNAAGVKLDPVVVKNISIAPAQGANKQTTKLFLTDLPKAPEGYTLCRVDDLAKIVKTIPSKIDVAFNMDIDQTKDQQIMITGEPYPFEVDYSIRIPLKFKEDAVVKYSDSSDVSNTFKDIDDYDITVDDILIVLNARTTLPIDMGVTIEMLDADGKVVPDVTASVQDKIMGYNPQGDGQYKESVIGVLLNVKDGNIQHLKRVTTIRYTIEGSTVGVAAGLSPHQYLAATMILRLKKGITFDLNNLFN